MLAAEADRAREVQRVRQALIDTLELLAVRICCRQNRCSRDNGDSCVLTGAQENAREKVTSRAGDGGRQSRR